MALFEVMGVVIASLLILLLSAIAILALLILLGKKSYGEDTHPDSIENIQLPDGWKLSIERHLPSQERRGVVITCHGLGANRFNMDLHDGVSIVHFLKKQGFEVWNVDLRGNGKSRYPEPFQRAKKGWNFDDHVREDVPAILERVIERSGAENVHWIGHSMGGMVMYAHLGCNPNDTRIASVCAIGSPVLLPRDGILTTAGGVGRIASKILGIVPAKLLSKATSPLYFWFPIRLYVAYPPNLSRGTVRRLLYKLPEDLSAPMIQQFTRWLQNGCFNSEDQIDDYRSNLAKIQTPFCLIAGSADQLAPVKSITPVFDELGSNIKEFFTLGKKTGATIDHCHGSLLLADEVHQDTFPLVNRWLNDRLQSRETPRDSNDFPWTPNNA